MGKTKTVVIVDSAGGTDDEAISGKNNDLNQNQKLEIKHLKDLNGPEKELFLLKLPKELIKYQKDNNDLKINLNDVKAGKKFTINGIDYEGSLSKSKVSFNCLCKKEDTYEAISNFKNVIDVKRCIEIPEVIAPQIEKSQVQIPESIENYLLNKEKSKEKSKEKLKKFKRKNTQLDEELEKIDKSLNKKLKNKI